MPTAFAVLLALLAMICGFAALFMADIAGEDDSPGYWRAAAVSVAVALVCAFLAGGLLMGQTPTTAEAALVTEAR